MKRFFVPRPARQRAVTVDQDGMVRISPTARVTPQERHVAYIAALQSLAGSSGGSITPHSLPPGGSADALITRNVTGGPPDTCSRLLRTEHRPKACVDKPSESQAGSADATADKALPAHGGRAA